MRWAGGFVSGGSAAIFGRKLWWKNWGVSQVTVFRIEDGDTKMDVEMLVRLSVILQATLNVIVGVTDELTSPEIPL